MSDIQLTKSITILNKIFIGYDDNNWYVIIEYLYDNSDWFGNRSRYCPSAHSIIRGYQWGDELEYISLAWIIDYE